MPYALFVLIGDTGRCLLYRQLGWLGGLGEAEAP